MKHAAPADPVPAPSSGLGYGLLGLLTFFTAVNQAWFMGFFFLLAGVYTTTSRTRASQAGDGCLLLLAAGVSGHRYRSLISDGGR